MVSMMNNESVTSREPQDHSPETDINSGRTSGLPALRGWRLCLAILSLSLGMLLSALETSIIATALVTISSDLGHFEKSSWVVVSYLLTYTGFLIVFARLSDIFGRKNNLLIAVGFFTIWSLACGLSQTIEQLIIFRALQGIGGSGIYALAMASMTEITSLESLGLATGAISAVLASSSVLGPVLGGAIASHTTWRWVFWLNVPPGAVIMALILWIFPQNIGQEAHSRALYAQVDWPGVVFSLAGSIMLVFPLEHGGVSYSWHSPAIIVSFVIAGLCWVSFAGWEAFLSSRMWKMLPIFPTRLATHRVIAAGLFSAFFTGFPFMVTIINLPQRFQVVDRLSPVDAGIRMLPLLLLSAFGAGVTGYICGKKNVAFCLLVLSNILQLTGTALISSLPINESIPASQYGYQVILGTSFGMGLTSLIIITRVEVAAENSAIMMGAITQVRVLGGVIGLAIAQTVLLSSVRSNLTSVLTPVQLNDLLSSTTSIASLPPETAQITQQVYGNASNLQMRIMSGFAGASVLASLCAWRRHAVEYADVAKRMAADVPDIPLKNMGKREESSVMVREEDSSEATAVSHRVDIEA